MISNNKDYDDIDATYSTYKLLLLLTPLMIAANLITKIYPQ